MSVLNEKKINNEIKERWKKDEYKRMIVDSEKVSDEFRVICSSRSSIIKIIEDIKKNGLTVDSLKNLKNQMEKIFDWFNIDTINNLKTKYDIEIKDRRKLRRYRNEIKFIDEYYNNFKGSIINITVDKLLKFHNLGDE